MKISRSALICLFAAIAFIAISGRTTLAQPGIKPKRVTAPTTIRGLVGGEANDTYVFRVRKRGLLTIQISWRKEDDNTASFGVGDSPTLQPVSFGKESNEGRKWVGRVPRAGDYYVEVVAHPRAHYVLKISVK